VCGSYLIKFREEAPKIHIFLEDTGALKTFLITKVKLTYIA